MRQRVARRPSRAPSKSPRASRISPICASDFASPGSSAAALRKCSSAASASPFCRSTPASSRYRNALSGELAIAARVGLHRLVEPAGRAPPRARAPAPARRCGTCSTSTRRAEVGQRRIGGQRRLERRSASASRLSASSACPRPSERRHVVVLRVELERAVEVRQRRLGVLARQLEVAERGLRRIERRRAPSARRRTRARRS